MKKQIGLIALSTILIAFVAFSSVASAQASNVQITFFYSPMCSICEQVKPLVESAAAQTGAKLIEYNVADTSLGQGVAAANGVTGTPTIVINGGQRLVGAVTEQQIVTAIQAAAGSATPAATATPTPKVVKATYKHVKATPTNWQPSITVVPATQTPTASTQTVPEFSLLGLGAPALVVGALYLFLRRR